MGLLSSRPAREALEGGGPEGRLRRGPMKGLQKEWIPSWWVVFGEASACY